MSVAQTKVIVVEIKRVDRTFFVLFEFYVTEKKVEITAGKKM